MGMRCTTGIKSVIKPLLVKEIISIVFQQNHCLGFRSKICICCWSFLWTPSYNWNATLFLKFISPQFISGWCVCGGASFFTPTMPYKAPVALVFSIFSSWSPIFHTVGWTALCMVGQFSPVSSHRVTYLCC